jgi:hypothetical protein
MKNNFKLQLIFIVITDTDIWVGRPTDTNPFWYNDEKNLSTLGTKGQNCKPCFLT